MILTLEDSLYKMRGLELLLLSLLLLSLGLPSTNASYMTFIIIFLSLRRWYFQWQLISIFPYFGSLFSHMPTLL